MAKMNLLVETDLASQWLCPTQLAVRRASSASASTSKCSAISNRSYDYAYGYQSHGKSEAKALSIPWEASSGDISDHNLQILASYPTLFLQAFGAL